MLDSKLMIATGSANVMRGRMYKNVKIIVTREIVYNTKESPRDAWNASFGCRLFSYTRYECWERGNTNARKIYENILSLYGVLEAR